MKICANTKCQQKKVCEFWNNFMSMEDGINYTVEDVKIKKDLSCFSLKEFYGN